MSQPVGSAHDRIVRWRQLVDLIARSKGEGDRELLAQALEIVRHDRSKVREPLRAAATRSIAGAPVPLALLILFAKDTLSVAAPLLAAADLDDETLLELRRESSAEVNAFLANLHPEHALAATPLAEPDAPVTPSIGDMVAKIERLRSERVPVAKVQEQAIKGQPEAATVETEPYVARPLPRRRSASDGPALFRWECNPGGEIDWVEGAPRGPLIGRSIADADPDEGVDDCVERAFKVRAPFRNCLFELQTNGELGGQWTISGAPAFAPGDGRFVGYRGVARRGLPTDGAQSAIPSTELPSGHDTLREIIHEIKTPLNAIIGFAEIIDGQYFGPAHRRYRLRAAQIVTNARLLLEAAEDLDFVARSQSDPTDPSLMSWVSDVAGQLTDMMVSRAVRRGVLIEIDDAIPGGGGRRLNRDLVERLGMRFADAIAGAASPGERLPGIVNIKGEDFILSMARPASLSLARGDRLLDPEYAIEGSDETALGLGFSLRLLNGLAGLAGGRLEVDGDALTLVLPTVAE
ncbi:MAG: hypothetical protein ABI667_01930 [Sphingomicrobium sp.]